MNEALAAWRATALDIVSLRIASTESQRELAWRFLSRNGARVSAESRVQGLGPERGGAA